ncbi:hypothetical protein QJS04_geneDACA004503 [Acorus gramineus]|uniref:Uncharacterized protein n=1 Tax=Acorus gramineus TaxID=55184 RepID=A0AAV9B147_ACOGR|nr:hypothetical protein QJS04_geneDACA004503 [Acorus gramineus]
MKRLLVLFCEVYIISESMLAYKVFDCRSSKFKDIFRSDRLLTLEMWEWHVNSILLNNITNQFGAMRKTLSSNEDRNGNEGDARCVH